MKKKTNCHLFSIYIPLLLAVFFGFALLQTGCNDAGGQTREQRSQTAGQNNSNNWISMKITFMKKTTEESRDRSVRAIEKMLIKILSPYTKEYANYYPSIAVTKIPFIDSLDYHVSVINTHYSKDSSGRFMLLSRDTTVHPPPCPPCPGICPACALLTTYVGTTYGIEKIVVEEK